MLGLLPVLTSCSTSSVQKITPAQAQQEILEVYQSRDQGFEAQDLDGVFHHVDKSLITDDGAKNMYSTFYHGSDFKSVSQIVKATFTSSGATVISTCTRSYKLRNRSTDVDDGIRVSCVDSYRCLDTWALRQNGWWLTKSQIISESHTRDGETWDPNSDS